MKARQQSLHDEGWQSGAGKETHAEKLDDVRVAERAHYSAFLHELRCGLADSGGRNVCRIQEKVVDLFGGADGSGHDHLLHAAVGSCADCGTS